MTSQLQNEYEGIKSDNANFEKALLNDNTNYANALKNGFGESMINDLKTPPKTAKKPCFFDRIKRIHDLLINGTDKQ